MLQNEGRAVPAAICVLLPDSTRQLSIVCWLVLIPGPDQGDAWARVGLLLQPSEDWHLSRI